MQPGTGNRPVNGNDMIGNNAPSRNELIHSSSMRRLPMALFAEMGCPGAALRRNGLALPTSTERLPVPASAETERLGADSSANRFIPSAISEPLQASSFTETEYAHAGPSGNVFIIFLRRRDRCKCRLSPRRDVLA